MTDDLSPQLLPAPGEPTGREPCLPGAVPILMGRPIVMVDTPPMITGDIVLGSVRQRITVYADADGNAVFTEENSRRSGPAKRPSSAV